MNIRETAEKLPRKGQALIGLVVLVLVLYFARHQLALSKEQAAFWDIIVKFIGGLVAVVGAIVALRKYFEEREKDNRAALLEAQKRAEEQAKANQAALIAAQMPFSSKRQEVYSQLVSATSLIAIKPPGDPLRENAYAQFEQLYYGGLPMVADDLVSQAVDRFIIALDHSKDKTELSNLSMDLARACRKSLGFIEYQ